MCLKPSGLLTELCFLYSLLTNDVNGEIANGDEQVKADGIRIGIILMASFQLISKILLNTLFILFLWYLKIGNKCQQSAIIFSISDFLFSFMDIL